MSALDTGTLMNTPRARWHLNHPFVQIFALGAIVCVFFSVRGDTLIASIGEYQFSTTDLFIVLGSVIALRVFRARTFFLNAQTLLIFLLLVLFVYNVARGITSNGFEALINLRFSALLPLSLVFFFSPALSKLDIDMLTRLSVITGCSLCVLVLLRIFVSPTLGLSILGTQGLETLERADAIRPLWAPGSFLLGLCALILLSNWNHNSKRMQRTSWLLALSFLVCLVLTKQLTATVGALSAIFAFFLYDSLLNRNKQSILGLGIVFGGGSIVAMFAMLFGIVNADSVNQFFELRSGTGLWRQAVWLGVWQSVESSSLVNQLFGLPIGTAQEVFVQLPQTGLFVWKHSAHSFYLESLRLVGWIGCLTLSGLAGYAILRALLKPTRGKALGVALVIGFAVYGYGYAQDEASVVMLVFGLRLCFEGPVQRSLERFPDFQPDA